MPLFKVQAPDGSIIPVNAPEGATEQQAIEFASKTWKPTANSAAVNPATGGGTLNFAGLDTGIPTSENMQNFLAGTGKAFSDIGTGIGQITGLGSATPADIAEQRKLDEPLMKTGAGLAGNLTGNIAATLPTMAIPGVNTYTGAAALGAGLSALQPTTSGMERVGNMALGGVSGLGGQALGNTLGRMVQPFKSSLSTEESRLAQVALDAGIPLSAGEQLGSKPLKIANAVMENLPLTAGPEAARRGAQQTAFNQAVLSKAGIQGDVATPLTLAAGKTEIGGKIGEYAKNYGLDFGQGLATKLDDIAKDAQSHLPPTQANQLLGTINQMKGQFTALNDAATPANSIMPGVAYQGWREPLRQLAKGADATSMYYGQIRKAMDDAFWNQLPKTADAKNLQTLRQQYANLKTVIGSMGGNSPSTLAGNISPAQLGMALSQAVGKEGKALGRGDLNDLVRAGNTFVRAQVPDSGTAQRQLIQALLTGGGGAVTGGLAAGATGHDPLTGALYGAGAMGAGMLTPRLIQSTLNAQPVQNYITKQAASPAALEMAKFLQNSGRTLGAAIPMALGE